jgi:DNA-binding NarL/FixJ family response regulator
MTLRIVVADDQELMRTGLRMVLEAENDFEIVGEAADGAEAVELARREAPDVVLMDVRMPGMDGIEATRQLAQGDFAEPVRVLILTTFDLDEYVYGSLRAGASGFLLKDAPPDQIAHAIRTVASGNALLAPTVTQRLIDKFTREPEPGVANVLIESLTDREKEVLKLVAQGFSNAEIAADLVVEETTVKSHVRHVLQKLGLRDRVQAVVAAYDAGLVRPRSS